MIKKASLIIPRMIGFKLAKWGVMKAPTPINLTFSVTNVCQSRCKTCFIWKLYMDNPKKKLEELKIDEIEKMFSSIGQIYFFNISGGEPFLRPDLPDIVRLAIKYLKPGIIHTPTNCLASEKVVKGAKEILKIIEESGQNIEFTIKPSFDGVGAKHDKIRGVKGNFKAVLKTVGELKKLKKRYSNFHIGLGTVISKFNINDLDEVGKYAKKLKVDSYISEIAENRTELFTSDKDIMPEVKDYAREIEKFSKRTKADLKKKRLLARITLAFRIVYYQTVVRILRQKRQVIPCYGGISNVHINSYGDVWPCCILGYDKTMGNVKDNDYDFKKIWHSKAAKEVRRFISDKKCHCPLANQAYSNLLLDPISLIKVVKNIIFG